MNRATLLNDFSSFLSFLDTLSWNYRLDLNTCIEIWEQSPDTKACETEQFWREGYQVSGETIILKVDEEFENAKEPYVIVNVPNIKTGYDGSILPVILGCFGGTGLTAALIVFLCNKRRKKNA